MNEAEIELLEQVIEQLKRTEVQIQTEITELQLRRSEVQGSIQQLVRLLPPEKRIDLLFH